MDHQSESRFSVGNISISRVEESDFNESSDLSLGSDQWIITTANKVYNYLGKGYPESVYHRAFEIELRKNGIKHATEVNIPILYEGEQVGIGRADIIIYRNSTPNNDVILEFKSIAGMIGIKEMVQIGHYMRQLSIPTGIIINFCQPTIEPGNSENKVVFIIGKNQE
jgi:GxxExxY protein